MMSRYRGLAQRSDRVAASSEPTGTADPASTENRLTSSPPNSLSRNCPVAAISGSSAYAPVNSSVSGSAVGEEGRVDGQQPAERAQHLALQIGDPESAAAGPQHRPLGPLLAVARRHGASFALPHCRRYPTAMGWCRRTGLSTLPA